MAQTGRQGDLKKVRKRAQAQGFRVEKRDEYGDLLAGRRQRAGAARRHPQLTTNPAELRGLSEPKGVQPMTEMTEIRARITVPDLPCDDEERWEPLADALERDHGEYGPILAWERDDLVAVLSL